MKYLIFSKVNSEVCTSDLSFVLCKLIEFKQKLKVFEKDMYDKIVIDIYINVCRSIGLNIWINI